MKCSSTLLLAALAALTWGQSPIVGDELSRGNGAAGVAAGTYRANCADTCNACCDASCWETDPADSGCYVFADWLNWRYTRSNLDYAVIDSGIGVLSGNIEVVDFSRDTGYRVGGAVRMGGGWEIGAIYTSFDTEASAAIGPAPGLVYPTRIHPLDTGILLGFTDRAEARSELDYSVMDALIGHSLHGDNVSLNLFGGLRMADIDQLMSTNYFDDDFAQVHNVHQTLDMQGLGLTMGSELRWQRYFNCWKLGLFGRFAGSVILGDFSASYVETDNAFGPPVPFAFQLDERRAVAALDTSAGISLGYDCLTLEAGYDLVNWFNMPDYINPSAGSFAFADLSTDSSNFGLDGFYVRAIVTL